MKIKLILVVIGLTCKVYSQGDSRVLPAGIGDKVPDLEFRLMNYPRPTAKLSDFRGKLVILDFWATWCAPCLKAFPKVDSLQEAYKEKMIVLLVSALNTGDNRQKVSAVFERLKTKEGKKYRLPVILEDTVLTAIFRHKIIPHYVWILDQKVIAITDSYALTGKNIEAAYLRQQMPVKMKIDVLDYNRNKLLFIEGNGGNGEKMLFRSIISENIEGLSTGIFATQKNGLITKLSMINLSLLSIYEQGYDKRFPKARTIIQVPDTASLGIRYCYEVVSRPMPMTELYQKVQADITSYFPYKAAIEARMIKCFVLQYDSSAAQVIYPFTNSQNRIAKKNGVGIASYLETKLNIPVIDESGRNEKIDIELPTDIVNVDEARKLIASYGFRLSEAERKIEVFVIKKK